MAWRRTTLAFAAVAVLGVRSALHGRTSETAYAAGALVALSWVAFLVVAQLRIRALAPSRPREVAPAGMWGAAGCVVGAAACAVVVLR
ncbi:hypothetical protein SRB5_33800 [Streptomyces sp. RB5]|uniref:DUF202 domain-containing protein n=2 Tax=Streptomyces smaragdinus TaxID=2585196 RepID=A0A7K0CID5_9ACTN|nr:hypothetical protein [Streptomyces smaragdinus]